jgi:hypothetical protein
VHVELHPAVRDEPAAALLLDDPLARRLEVLAIEARRVRRRREKRDRNSNTDPNAMPRECGRSASAARARVDVVPIVEQLVLPIAQIGPGPVVEDQ